MLRTKVNFGFVMMFGRVVDDAGDCCCGRARFEEISERLILDREARKELIR